jgi:hypothetical protein
MQGAEKLNCPQKSMTQRTEQKFFKERKKSHEKCLPSLAIKEMQIKTTLRFHLIPVRIAITSHTTNNRYW